VDRPECLEDLVRQAAAGDLQSFDWLVERYQGVVFGLAYDRVRSFADAQALTQETFCLAFEHIGELREAARFPAWLSRIASNQCAKWARRRRPGTVSMDAPEVRLRGTLSDPAPLADHQLESAERHAAVRTILDRLSGKERLAVTLYYLDDLSYRQISEFLDVPVSTVKGRLHKARRHLKKEALAMVEEVLGSPRDRPRFETDRIEGYLSLQEDGSGHLRPTLESPASPADVEMSATYVALHGLVQGDFVRGQMIRWDIGQGTRGAIRFEEINGKPAVPVAAPTPAAPPLSARVEGVRVLAREAARRRGFGYIGTEHLLLGILADREGTAGSILVDLGVDPAAFQRQVEGWFSNDAAAYVEGETDFTPRATKILESAAGEAETRSATATEVEHLLLALARDRNGAAAQALWKVGVDVGAIEAHMAC